MSLSKANITTLAGVIANGLDDATTISRFFDDLIAELGFLENPVFFNIAATEVTAATAVYNFPSGALRLFEQFYGDKLLFSSTENELDAYSKTYRTDTGDPKAATVDLLNNQFRLYPNPTSSSTPGGDSLDASFTDDWVWTIFSLEKSSGFHDTYGVPAALLTLAKEFSYASEHQDLDFAANCLSLGKLILNVLGHDYK